MPPKSCTGRRSTSPIPNPPPRRPRRPREHNVTTTTRILDLGRRRFAEVWEYQRALHAAVAEGRTADTWIVVEHDPVITLGRNAHEQNVLLPRPLLAARGVDVHAIERGGDVTYHGPGQVVVYPIMRLARFREIVPLVTALEEGVIAALRSWNIEAATKRTEHRGVYVGDRAICAIGLAVQRMTSFHGIALNASTALDYDRLITPCGTPEFGITSISNEVGRDVSWAEARDVLLPALAARFERTLIPITEDELARELATGGAVAAAHP